MYTLLEVDGAETFSKDRRKLNIPLTNVEFKDERLTLLFREREYSAGDENTVHN